MRFIVRGFDIFAAPLFKIDSEGRQVFFPWGFWGSGYVIADAEAAARLRRIVRTTWMVFFLVGIPVITLFARAETLTDFLAFVAIGSLSGLGMSLWFRWLARGLPRADLRLSMREAQDAQTRAMGRSGLLVMLALSLMLIVLGAVAIAIGGREGVWLGTILIAMFGACLAVFLWQWRRLQRLGG
jgi:hypothetical protein